ncbi:VOC family protein [Phenylobacterium aquaticum]|uniref:VOC family protein n=1 Tax=Phenylobacterium aquaticum TaxID=1763816 RepID=UPI001F5DE936|nr:VOC family protein [Phenylobacterium aquaticum]MCI3132596.1 VOC family protein [Phenylobacterium aquaticum]
MTLITALDHVALAVNDLDAAVANYRALLGREPNWLGGDGGARHAWFQFPNMALDVITPHGEGAFGDTIRKHLAEHGEGIWAVAFTVENAEAAQKLVGRRGLRGSVPGPTRSTHDDGRKRYWTTSALNAADTGGLNILLVDPPRSGEPWPQSPVIGDAAATVTELDHVVVTTVNADRALAIWGAKLGLDLRLDRSNEQWGVRQLFFRCGSAVVEMAASLKTPSSDGPDSFGGLAWRVADADAAQARLAAAGFNVSEVRVGRKPGTRVFTARNVAAGVPTILIQQNA